jgi:5-methylcytosine-specific restriction endonuclease McrA
VECGRSFKSAQFKAKCCKPCLSAYLSRRVREHFQANPPATKWPTRQDANRFYGFRRRRVVRGRETDVFGAAEIYERDGWRCKICGRKVDREMKHPDPMSASLDHIMPISLGGQHIRSNCQLAHLGCNSRKGARSGGQLLLFG